jgi:hypothetical protein
MDSNMISKRAIDITGQIFGSLTALKQTHVKNHMAYWDYQCACGRIHNARANTITHQCKKKADLELPSCGCVELARKTKHGYRKAKDTHPAYRAYRGMMDRCYNTNSSAYQWYGAKGVTVCEEWKGNPAKFVDWAIANGWKPSLHIDKDILCDSQGITPHVYSPNTCQWVTPKVNVGYATDRSNYGVHPNVRLSHKSVAEILGRFFSDEDISQSDLAREYGVTPNSVYRLVCIAKGAA